MTERLYYTDARCAHFTGTVVALEDDGRRVILDRTAFYPTSGGQPFDTGRLGSAAVIDVIDEDDRIVHVCDAPISARVGDVVEGTIDWTRRYDHMQQHTGQHLLSALLADGYGWPTVSVHFGALTNTVDVAATQVTPEQVVEIEQRVNALAADNLAVHVSFEDAATATGLRKASDRDGELRIVTIDGVDRSACGGTHVARTGEIGAVMLRRIEKTKGHTRLEFVCGRRAVARARLDAQLLGTAARVFTAAPDDVPQLVDAQQKRVAELERDRKRLLGELAQHQAQQLWDAAPVDAHGVRRIALPAADGAVRDLESLVQAIVTKGAAVVLAVSPSTGGIMLGAGDGSGVDAGQALRSALQAEGGKGGGSPRLAQGSTPGSVQLSAVVRALGFSF